MKECKDPQEIEYLLKTNCANDITKMLLMVNNVGETPIDLLLANYHFDNDTGWSIYNKLLNLIKDNQEFKPLHEDVSLQELMPNNITDKELKVSLELACSVMNDTRHLIPFSFTHPSCNFYDLDQKARVFDQICFLIPSFISLACNIISISILNRSYNNNRLFFIDRHGLVTASNKYARV